MAVPFPCQFPLIMPLHIAGAIFNLFGKEQEGDSFEPFLVNDKVLYISNSRVNEAVTPMLPP